MHSITKRLAPAMVLAAFGLPVALAVPATAAEHGGTELMAELDELNDSGGSGVAWAMVEGTQVHVKIEVEGLLDAPHAQHIHIGGENSCPDPNMEGTGFEGAIRTTDAVPSYGPVQVSLTEEPGSTGADHALDVDHFPATGSYTYERTFEVPQDVADSIAAGDGVVVVHGVDHDGSGAYDGEQESDLDPALPSEATDPALCGELDPAQMEMPDGGVETGGGDTAGTELSGALAAGAVLMGAGAVALAAGARRRGTDS